MKIEISALLPKLREFVLHTLREDQSRETWSSGEISGLLGKHFQSLTFSDLELVGSDYHTSTLCNPERRIKIALQQFFPKDNVELRIDSTKLTLHYLQLRHLTMEGWGYGCKSLPEPFATQMQDFISEIKSRSRSIEITFPERVQMLQISELGHTCFGFESEIETFSKKIELANHPKNVTSVKIGVN